MLKNNVQLIGNLGNDPKITTLDSGKKVANFSLATNETYKDANGEKVTTTQWHNCTAWGNVATVVENHVKKSDRIAVSGKLTYRKYDDKDGNPQTTTEIVVNEVLLLGNKTAEKKGE